MSLEVGGDQPGQSPPVARRFTSRHAIALAFVAVLAATAAWRPADLFYSKERAVSAKVSSVEAYADLSPEKRRALEAEERRDRLTFVGVFVAILGGSVCGALGIVLGAMRRGAAGAVGGLLTGVVIGGGLGFVGGAAGKVLSDKYRIIPYHTGVEKLSRTIGFQSAAFVLIALAVAAMFLIWGPALRGRRLRVLCGSLLAGALSSLLYLAITSVVAPLISTDHYVPLDSTCRLVWFTAPAFLISLAAGLLAVESGAKPIAIDSEPSP